ncbi:YfhO family protein [Anaerorhabdus sp.]|nr:YfhO family protein [Anaerorhabdus sp.]MEA4875899.1 YfhO family protein [Anaerorhabdus sp.]
MIKTIKQNYKLYLFVLILLILFFLPYIILNNGIILQPGDPFELNYKLWLGGYNQVHLGEIGQFNWSLGFGANTLSYVFYFLTNPFFFLSLLFPRDFIPYSFLVFGILQLWLGFIFTHVWLKKITTHNLGAIIGAFIICFSAYGIFYFQAEQFLKCLFLYPLALYFTECFLANKKHNGLVITIAVMGITQFYLLYQFIPFICLYALLRYLIIYQNKTKAKEIILTALKFVGWLVLGIGISAIILVPCAYLILSIPRFTTSSIGLFDHLDRFQLYEVISSMFTPIFQKLDANAFIAANQHEFFGWSGSTPLYSLIITPCLLPLIFFIKNKFQRNCYLAFYSLLGFFLFFQIFSYIFQASIDTRWYYMFLFFNAYLAAIDIDKYEDQEYSKKQILISFSIPIILIIAFTFISSIGQLNTVRMLMKLGLSSLVMIVLILAYGFIFYKKLNKKFLFILISLEIIFTGVVFYYFNEPISAIRFDSKEIKNDVPSYFHNLDDGFYRVMYDSNTVIEWRDGEEHIQSLTTANEPMANAFPGFAFYESVYNTNQEEFMARFKTVNNMKQLIGRTKVYNLLSAKYWYTFNYEDAIPYGYNKIHESPKGYTVYENENFVELGFAYNKTINKDFLLTLPFLEQDRIMQEYLAVENSTNTTYTLNDNIELLTVLPTDTIRVYDFEEPVKDVNIYLEVFGLPNTKITTYYQDEVVNKYDLWQFNYIDFPVYEYIDKIVIESEDIYGYGTEVPLYIEPFDESYSENFKNLTSESFKNVIFTNDIIQGDITISGNEKYVFTSIPYDKGWSVYVNGEKINYEKVQLGFIGFKLQPGTYHVEFKYQIPFLNVGVGITTISILILIVINLIVKKRH